MTTDAIRDYAALGDANLTPVLGRYFQRSWSHGDGHRLIDTDGKAYLDFANGITLNGFTVPALKTSKLSTDVITRDGESIVMGGLMRRVESKNVQKFPILGNLPILGPLFRSTTYQKNESDVIFVMTPTIVTR